MLIEILSSYPKRDFEKEKLKHWEVIMPGYFRARKFGER